MILHIIIIIIIIVHIKYVNAKLGTFIEYYKGVIIL